LLPTHTDGYKYPGASTVIMGVRGNIFQNFAVCKASVNKNNSITIGKDNRAGTDIDLGDEVRVRIIKLQGERFVKPRDVRQYTTTIQQTGQIHIPNEIMNRMGLEAGEIVGYMAVATKKIPSLNNGPVREAVSSEPDINERTRESNTETFTGPVAVTGQVTVPQEVREPMNIRQGDNVTVTINGSETRTLQIGTGNRITIPADVRDEQSIEKGDDATLRVAVF